METYLIIDSSSERVKCGICHKGGEGWQEVARRELPPPPKSSQLLVEEIAALIEVHPINGIVLGVGPGSYTGLRVGAAVAEGLSLALECPVRTCCSLAGYPCRQGGVVLSDARIGGVYLWKGDEPHLVGLESLSTELTAVEEIVVPVGQSALRARLAPYLEEFVGEWREEALSLELLGERSGEVERLELLYLRPTQAEIERGQQVAIDK